MELDKKFYSPETLKLLKNELLRYDWQGYAVLTFAALPYGYGVHELREKFFTKLAKDSIRDMNVFWFYKSISRRWYLNFMIDLDNLPFKHVHYTWFYIACRNFPSYRKLGKAAKVTWLEHEKAIKKVNMSISYLKNHGQNDCDVLGIGCTYGFFHGKAGSVAPSSKG